jgi:hypothetical protein
VKTGIVLGLFAVTLTACAGFGVQDAEKQSRDAHEKEISSGTVGFSIWSMFSSSREFVSKRLNPGLGKTKVEQIATLGQPFQCSADQVGGEICGWYDSGMSEGSITDANQHRVFYVYDQKGVARQWLYQGLYGKLSSQDSLLPSPSSAP